MGKSRLHYYFFAYKQSHVYCEDIFLGPRNMNHRETRGKSASCREAGKDVILLKHKCCKILHSPLATQPSQMLICHLRSFSQKPFRDMEMLLLKSKHCVRNELLFPFILYALPMTGRSIKSSHKLSQITSEFLSTTYHKYNIS